MFAEDQRSLLRLKDGVWVAEDRECAFDSGKARKDWPKCVDWSLLRDNKFVAGPNSAANMQPADLFIATGSPSIVQILVEPQEPETKKVYVFLALEPRTVDPNGQISSVATWPVNCGKETEEPSGKKRMDQYPGFDEDCQPASADALRAAAIASRPSEIKTGKLRWVRADP